jgi:hypothetical protein
LPDSPSANATPCSNREIPIWGKVVFGVPAVAGAFTVLSLSVLLRAHERRQALRNVAFAQAMEVTMADSADQDTTVTQE